MRSKKEFENEKYFGLQKFRRISDAFNVMSGEWGEVNNDCYKNLLIMQDNDFKSFIFGRALKCCIRYKLGLISQEEYEKALWLGNCSSDYLMDCDFFLHSEVGRCFYTCRMSLKDDAVHLWNKKQWRYYDELFGLYEIDKIIEKAQKAVSDDFEKNGGTEVNDLPREEREDMVYYIMESIIYDLPENEISFFMFS